MPGVIVDLVLLDQIGIQSIKKIAERIEYLGARASFSSPMSMIVRAMYRGYVLDIKT